MGSFFKFIAKFLCKLIMLAFFPPFFLVMIILFIAMLICDAIAYHSDIVYLGESTKTEVRRIDRRNARGHKTIGYIADYWFAIFKW